VQLVAVSTLVKSFLNHWEELKNSFSAMQKLLFKLLITVFITRTLFQFALVIPEMAEMAVLLRLFIIGFIHLNMLGFFTAYLWLEYLTGSKVENNTLLRSAVLLLVLGFLMTELIMFLQGFYYWQELGKLPYFHEGLFYASCILPIAIALFVIPFEYVKQSPMLTERTKS